MTDAWDDDREQLEQADERELLGVDPVLEPSAPESEAEPEDRDDDE